MALQLIGYILSITGLCGLIIGIFTNEWEVLGHDNDKTVILDKYKGLWMECSEDSSSHMHCTSNNSHLHQTCEYLSVLWVIDPSAIDVCCNLLLCVVAI